MNTNENQNQETQEINRPDMTATINWQDGALRLYCSGRVSKEDYKALRDMDFGHRRGETTFKAAYTVSREKFLLERFGVELEDDDTDIIVEAEERAERYSSRSDKAHHEYQSRHETAHRMADVIPFGQPILVGHHSEGRDRRYRERIRNNFAKAFEAYDKSNYWQRRAESALRRAEIREKAPAIHRRIDTLEAELRKMQRNLEEAQDAALPFFQRWIWFYENRLAFERALLAALPEEQKPLDKSTFKKGGAFFHRGSWHIIERVNQKTLSYTSHRLGLKALITDILPGQYLSPEQFEAAEKVQTHGGGYLIKARASEPVVTTTAIVPVGERMTIAESTFRQLPKTEQPADILTSAQRAEIARILKLPRTVSVAVSENKHGVIRLSIQTVEMLVHTTAYIDGGCGSGGSWLRDEKNFTFHELHFAEKGTAMHTLYTVGYAGLKREILVAVIKAQGWVLVDTRMNPVSRGGEWNKGALKAALDKQYIHMEALGNKNYKNGGEIALVNPEFGVRAVGRLLETQPVVLLCGCADVHTCHRKVAAELVAAECGEIPGFSFHHFTKKEVLALAAPTTSQTPAAQPEPAPVENAADTQLALPGIGKDKRVRVQQAQPKQMSMFSPEEMTGRPSNAFETGGKLSLITESEPHDQDAEARAQTPPLV
jgi:hypothetical protein